MPRNGFEATLAISDLTILGMAKRKKGKRRRSPRIKVTWQYLEGSQSEEALERAFEIVFRRTRDQNPPDRTNPGRQLRLW